MPQGALAALPPGVALALAVAVLAVGVAQQGAHACGKEKRENGVSKLEKLDAVLTNCETSSGGSTKGGGGK